MSTYTATPKDIEHRWYIVDADGMVLGRLAAEIVRVLRGKHKPMYTPHMDTGDNVIVINAAKVKLTGRKLEQKKYFTHTGYMGHERHTPAGRNCGCGRRGRNAQMPCRDWLGRERRRQHECRDRRDYDNEPLHHRSGDCTQKRGSQPAPPFVAIA